MRHKYEGSDFAPYGTYQPGLGKGTRDRQYGERAEANEQEIIYTACRTYESFLEAWSDAREESKRAFRFAEGEPWTAEKEAALLNAGMPALKINKIWPRLLRIMGQEAQVRKKIQALPRKANTEDGSTLANDIFDWIDYNSELQDQFSYAFLHALIGQLGGWVRVRWDTQIDPLGIPIVSAENPFTILDDPSTELYDLRRKNAMIRSYMAHVDDIVRQYPDKKRDITSKLNYDKDFSFRERLSNWFTRVLGSTAADFDDLMNEREGFYRLIEYQQREQVHIYKAVNPYTGAKVDVDSRRDEEILKQSGFDIIDRHEDRIRTVVTCADLVVLENNLNEVQNGMFDLFPVGGFVMLGRSEGAVKQWMGPIEEIVKSRSAFLHMLTSNAVGGWQVPKNSLDVDELQKLNRDGNKPNYVQVFDPQHGKPTRIQQTFPGSGEINRFDLANMDLMEISALDKGELGLDQADESGVLHRQKVAQAMLTYEPFLKNVDRSKGLVGEYLLDLMRSQMNKLPSNVRAIDIPRLENDQLKRFDQIQVRSEDLNDEYAVIVKTGFDNDLQRYRILAMIMEMEKTMPPELVPWHLKIKLTDWPEDLKKEYLEYVEARLGLSPQEQRGIATQLMDLQNQYRTENQGAGAALPPMPAPM